MRRREFITMLGGATAWPLTAHAQQRALPVIGFLHAASPNSLTDRLNMFRQGLNESGSAIRNRSSASSACGASMRPEMPSKRTEISPLARDPSLQAIQTSHVEEFGAGRRAPADAIVHFQGNDAELGPMLRYTIVKPMQAARTSA
jgi:Protein of unknown function (DUF3182)